MKAMQWLISRLATRGLLMKKDNVRRSISITGTAYDPPDMVESEVLLKTLALSKFATPNVEQEFIHLDKLPDGTWRLLFNVKDVEINWISSLRIVREND